MVIISQSNNEASNNQTPLLGPSSNTLRSLLSNSNPKSDDQSFESLPSMIRAYFLQHLRFFSFGVLFSILLTLCFLAQLTIDGVKMNEIEWTLFPINWEGPMTSSMGTPHDDTFSGKAVYQLLTSLLVHANFKHLIFNCFFLVLYSAFFMAMKMELQAWVVFFVSGWVIRLSGKSVRPSISGHPRLLLRSLCGHFRTVWLQSR